MQPVPQSCVPAWKPISGQELVGALAMHHKVLKLVHVFASGGYRLGQELSKWQQMSHGRPVPV
eukprot:1159877-Pelagomonas_calceolata.AAC.7